MNAEVTGCSDCPMAGAGYPSYVFCQHPESVTNEPIEEKDGELVTPEYCPLKFDPIIITIKTHD